MRCRIQRAGSDRHVLALLVEGHLDGFGSGGLSLGLFISLVDHSVVSSGMMGNDVVGSILSPEPKTVK